MKSKVSNKTAKSSTGTATLDRGRRRDQRISNLLFLVLGMALMAGAMVVRPLPLSSTARPIAPLRPTTTAPWGELERLSFSLEEPDGYLPDSEHRLPAARWYFEKTSPAAVRDLFASLDVPREIRGQLLDTNHWQAAGDGVLVNPTSELILGLNRSAREKIYSLLAQNAVNFPQCYPFRFRADGFKDWFAHSRLSPEKIQLVQSLIYTNRGGAVCLADIDVLQEKFTAADFRSLFESLYSEPSLLLSVQVHPSTDINALSRYWGRGGREQEVATILKSVANLPGGGSINVAYLLPPFARLRLYTFAPANTNSPVDYQDCFWTALNFLKCGPSGQTTNTTSSLAALNEEFTESRQPPQLGDVLLLLEGGRPAHACVYIADDVVFTKNGANYHQPWVLMRTRDLIPRYATDRSMSLLVLKPKYL